MNSQSSKALPVRPYVGFGVFVFNSKGQILLLHRVKKGHGRFTWGLPGGHWEPHIFAGEGGHGESLLNEAVKRELKEETDLDCKTVVRLDFQDSYFPEIDRWYITLYVVAQDVSGEAKNMEPDKHSEMHWFSLDDLPTNTFESLRQIIKHNRERLNQYLPRRW